MNKAGWSSITAAAMPFLIRNLEIDIAERDGLPDEEVEQLREENWSACKA